MKESFDGNTIKYGGKNERELSSSYIDFKGKLGEEISQEISQEMYDTCCEKLEEEIKFFKYIIEDSKHPENAEEVTQIKFEEFEKITELFKKVFQGLQNEAEEICLTLEDQTTREISEKARILYRKLSNLRIKANRLNHLAEKLNYFKLSDFEISQIIIPTTGKSVGIKDAFDLTRLRNIEDLIINYDKYKEIQAELIRISNKFPEESKKREPK